MEEEVPPGGRTGEAGPWEGGTRGGEGFRQHPQAGQAASESTVTQVHVKATEHPSSMTSPLQLALKRRNGQACF